MPFADSPSCWATRLRVASAVPVRDASGELSACLFSHAPVIRCGMEALLEFVPRLRTAAKELEAIVGA